MIYLDQQLQFRITVGATHPAAGNYQFRVYQYDIDASTEEDMLIYTGNFYYNGTSYYQTIDLTDLIRSRRYVQTSSTFLDSWSGTGYMLQERALVHKYKVSLIFGGTTVSTGWNDVAMIYRRPFMNNWTDGSTVYTTISSSLRNEIIPALQSTVLHPQNEVKMLPRYPLKDTRKFIYAQSFLATVDMLSFKLHYYDEYGDVNEYVDISAGHDVSSSIVYTPLNVLIDFDVEDVGEYDLQLQVCNNAKTLTRKIGVFEKCYKRFYLQWQDRYGGFQCQPFNNRIQYSEDFDVDETLSYTNERKKSFIGVNPKWKLDSGWIEEKYFPIYESIFVSSVVILYDAELDKSYPVIVTGNYTEKKYKNEKKMLNISLDLEHAIKQNILY